MSRRAADEVAMHYHLALDALRMYRGTEHTVRMLAQTLIRASFIADAGYGKLAQEQFQATEAALVLAFDHGSETGDWCLDADAFCLCAALVTLHDQQLRSAPVSVISKANDRLALFGAGERKSRAAGDSKPAAKAGLVRKIERSRPKQHLDALAERDAPRTMVFPRF
jgi:hypothetical protein